MAWNLTTSFLKFVSPFAYRITNWLLLIILCDTYVYQHINLYHFVQYCLTRLLIGAHFFLEINMLNKRFTNFTDHTEIIDGALIVRYGICLFKFNSINSINTNRGFIIGQIFKTWSSFSVITTHSFGWSEFYWAHSFFTFFLDSSYNPKKYPIRA